MKPNWIWLSTDTVEPDSYAGFKTSFVSSGEPVTLRVAVDGIYAAFINGRVVLFSQCADYPHYKLYDEITLTDIQKGENELYIIAWHSGVNSQIYVKDTPGVWFEVLDGDITVAASGADTPSRLETNYKQNYCKTITHQLGFSYYYDNSFDNTAPYLPSTVTEKLTPVKRPQKPLFLDGRIPATYTDKGDHIF